MNKENLKELFLFTTIGKDSVFYEAWKHAITSIDGLHITNCGANGLACCDSAGVSRGRLKEFDAEYVKNNFPTLSEFLTGGDKLRVGDWILGYGDDPIKLSKNDYVGWNVPSELDSHRHVIFAQCWLDEKSKRHPHADMIHAKAENMDLVVFRCNPNGEWVRSAAYFPLLGNCKYLLCLPKHEEAVLNCLNGGESLVKISSSGPWNSVYTESNPVWERGYWYMDEFTESRIKPVVDKVEEAAVELAKIAYPELNHEFDVPDSYKRLAVALNYNNCND